MGELPRPGQIIRIWNSRNYSHDATVVECDASTLTVAQWRVYNGPEDREPERVVSVIPWQSIRRWKIITPQEAFGTIGKAGGDG